MPNSQTHQTAYLEYQIRGQLFGYETAFALEPLVKSGALVIEAPIGSVVPDDGLSRAVFRLQDQMALTGDTQYVSVAEMMNDAGALAEYTSYATGAYGTISGARAGISAIRNPEVRQLILKASTACVAAGIVGCTAAAGSAINDELKNAHSAINRLLRERNRVEQIKDQIEDEARAGAKKTKQY
jgi:hypothetical protein